MATPVLQAFWDLALPFQGIVVPIFGVGWGPALSGFQCFVLS